MLNCMVSVGVVGPLTKDRIIFRNKEWEQIGGTVYYTGVTLASLGINTLIYTTLSKNDEKLLEELSRENIKIFPRWCEKTTYFENIYPKKTLDYREQIVTQISQPFPILTPKDIESCDIVHLGPLNKFDIPLEFVKHIKDLGVITSLDAQGYVRSIEEGRVVLSDWKDKHAVLSYIDIIKVDETEATILTGKTDPEDAAKELSVYGPKLAVITYGEKGSLVYSKNEDKFFHIPAYKPEKIRDVTGAGDVYMGGFLYFYLSSPEKNFEFIGKSAAMCATVKIESGSPLNFSRNKIEKRLRIVDVNESKNNSKL
ncbi:MAG: PfkB family carbohydrate kinase [Candidatus Aenigmarchaeota archaeon]|nr:PfkB family carbohydrate kinase [Candidatus Aenigmarchaeota archaeon]